MRLAAKLCGWKIDIKSHTQFEEAGGTYDSLRTEADDDAGEDFIAYGEENTFAEEESYEAVR